MNRGVSSSGRGAGPWQRVRVGLESLRSVRIASGGAALDPVRFRTGVGVEHSGGEIDVFPNIGLIGLARHKLNDAPQQDETVVGVLPARSGSKATGRLPKSRTSASTYVSLIADAHPLLRRKDFSRCIRCDCLQLANAYVKRAARSLASDNQPAGFAHSRLVERELPLLRKLNNGHRGEQLVH